MSHSLEQLAPSVLAFLADDPAHGRPNTGVVVTEDGLTVFDATCTPRSATDLTSRMRELTESPVRRVILSSSHIEWVGGTPAFSAAAIYGTAQTSDHLDQPPNPAIWSRLHPDFSGEFADLVTKPVSHTVTEPAYVDASSIAIPVGGQQRQNLVMQVPSANVVFAGAVASFGVTPLGFEADFEAWIATLETMEEWGELIVPGHGPVGGHEELRTLRRYLEACIQAAGDIAQLAPGPWDEWTDRRLHEVNVERAAMSPDDPNPPASYLRLLDLA